MIAAAAVHHCERACVKLARDGSGPASARLMALEPELPTPTTDPDSRPASIGPSPPASTERRPELLLDAPPLVPARPAPTRRLHDLRSAIRLDWRLKGTIQSVLGWLPRGGQLHYVLQHLGGGLASFDRECDSKVNDWRLMMGHLATAEVDVSRATMLEIGSGWYPTFPVCLYLAGASRIMTFDIERHLRSGETNRLVSRLARHVPTIAHVAGRPEAEIEARRVELALALARGESLAKASRYVIDYRAPGDASDSALPTNTVDVVFSNSVLEHVRPMTVVELFGEARRILRPGGVMFHSVNCGDHYAYSDPAINQLNYLQYSERKWRRWNNTFLYQNRLRAIDFTRLAQHAGFTIEIDTSHPRPERLAQLDAMKVDPRFGRYTREQLAITTIDFVARSPRG